jgi:hypothetical protein
MTVHEAVGMMNHILSLQFYKFTEVVTPIRGLIGTYGMKLVEHLKTNHLVMELKTSSGN